MIVNANTIYIKELISASVKVEFGPDSMESCYDIISLPEIDQGQIL